MAESSVSDAINDQTLLLPETKDNDGDELHRATHRINNRNLYLASGAMLFGSLSIGVALGMSSPMIPAMQEDKSSTSLHMTESDFTWFVSLLNLGGIVGSLIGGEVMEFFGRKLASMLCGVPFVGGMLMVAFAKNVPTILIGRTFTGIACASASVITSIYMSETSTENLRGVLGSLNQMVVCTGMLLAYVYGIFMSWRWTALACAIPCVLWTVSAAFIPESPRYLLIRHKRNEARKSMVVLRGKDADVDAELDAIDESIKNTPESASWVMIFKDRSIRVPLFIGIGMAFIQQWSGVQCVMMYSETIFKNAGFTSETQLNVAVIILSAIQIVSAIVPFILLDRVDSGSLNWLAIASLVIYVAGYNMGLGPIFWLVISELMPLRAKGKATGLVICSFWIIAFVVTKEFYKMQEAFTPQGIFWMFSATCIAGIFFHWFLVPETKGRTLEEISADFEKHGDPAVENTANSS